MPPSALTAKPEQGLFTTQRKCPADPRALTRKHKVLPGHGAWFAGAHQMMIRRNFPGQLSLLPWNREFLDGCANPWGNL